MNKDSIIIEKIKEKKREFMLRTGKKPDRVFINPVLLSINHEVIDDMTVFKTPYIKQVQVILAVSSELTNKPFFEEKLENPVLPVWHRDFPDRPAIVKLMMP